MQAVGLGCMRLSTGAARDDAAALDVLRAAVAAGVDLLDTAHAYGQGAHDMGHNERLIGALLREAPHVTVVTKAGMTRPRGRWVPDGRARTIRAHAAASAEALGRAPDVLLLHVPDPRVPLATQARALAAVLRAGEARAVGVCNATVGQLEAFAACVPLAAVQVELGVRSAEAARGGVARWCVERGVTLLAHRPLGGEAHVGKLARHRVLAAEAARLGWTSEELALAWLRDLHAAVVPLPGATRVETAVSAARAARRTLDDAARDALAAAFPHGDLVRFPLTARRPRDPDGDVVITVGVQGAGKSTAVQALVDDGYVRLNRDERGGTLAGLLEPLRDALRAGRRRVVLDNTYVARAQRQPVLEAAWAEGAPVRCVWFDTPVADAQVNCARRLVDRVGHLPSPEELDRLGKTDPQAFGPSVLDRTARALEPPADDEGFASIARVPFSRRREGGASAWFVELDALVIPDGPGVALVPARAAAVRRAVADGAVLVGLGWRPDVDAGRISEDDARAGLAAIVGALGVPGHVALCPHGPGPARCWCRVPLPGLVVEAAVAHGLDLAGSAVVGRSAAWRALADAVGARFLAADALHGR